VAYLDPWTSLEAAQFGLYVHFPYCLARCPYCDFAVTVAKKIPQERYTQAVVAELSLRAARANELSQRTLDSVFMGGGTPSLWDPRQLGLLMGAVQRAFALAPSAEVSLEGNPEVSDQALLGAFLDVGVNRLSLGVQSFQRPLLKTLGRDHEPAEAEAAILAARKVGFPSVCVDLIYGVPGQSVAMAREDARRAVELGVDHVSAYALTVDRPSLALETVMSRRVARGELTLPQDEDVVAMANAIEEGLLAGGLLRYEISNFARPGRHSRHNALYWTGGECLALGTGATGLVKSPGTARAVRTTNHRSTERFLAAVESGKVPDESVETLGDRELFEERLAMGLRLTGGVDLGAVCGAFGEALGPRRARADRLVADGFCRWDGPRLALTSRGAQLHTEIAAQLL
jgi:oxygen-independent coproporphyrinogen-3 oxidase